MVFEELQRRYGSYRAEMIRQSMTLEDFAKHEIEELVPYFELKAERLYEEYRSRLNAAVPDAAPLDSTADYLEILRRRWQQAEEMAHLVLTAEKEASDQEVRAIGA